MIDTVVLRLHDIRKYDVLIRRLRLKKNKGFKLKTATIDVEEAQKLRRIGNRKPKEILDILEINRTGEYLIKTEVSKQVNSSGHYAFAYRIDHTNDYIEFNFSIPKYKFGSNVLMDIEHSHNVYFQYTRNNSISYNIRKCLSSFKPFIEQFLRSEFPIDDIDLRDLEVNRIDVCYNQVFKSKEEAIAYFNLQKRINKKYSREEDGGKTDWNTSFMYKTKRFSFKIYHKGTEYKKHDLKEHLRINEEKGEEYFKTHEFQRFADRMLRYELTIRAAELNYLFKHNIFRRNCPFFKIDYKNFLRIENKIKRNDRRSKIIGSLPANQKDTYREAHPYEKITKDDRLKHKYVSELINRKPYFMMKIDERDKIYNEVTINDTPHAAEFSKGLLWLCVKKLFKFISEFKIKELPAEERIAVLIDQYNLTHKVKMQKSSMLQFYPLLIKYGSFKEAAKFGRKDRSTMYRFKEKFKKLGITETHVQPDVTHSIPQPSSDFTAYHEFFHRECNLLKGISKK